MIKFFLIVVFFITALTAKSLELTTDEWFPYTSSSNNGIVTEIIEEVFKSNGSKINISYQSFEKGYNSTLKNKYDATYPYFKTTKRGKEILYSEPLYVAKNILFFNKNKFTYNEKDIYDHTIGLVKGYAYKNIDESKFTKKVYISNELDAFDMLNKGEIDLLPSNKLVGIHIIKKYFNDFYSNIDYVKNEKFISSDTLHLLFHNNVKNKKLLSEFNDKLKEIKENGKYKKIILRNNSLINTNLANVVNLSNNVESFPMVVATEKLNSKEKYIIPRGTKAVVLKWSKHFKQKGKLKIYDEMFKKTKVKIVNGPLKGKILYVENMYIEIN